ncbi:MAG: Rid family hydrolase [Isosphaeraceae bacterium]
MAAHIISRASHGAIDLATVHLSGVRHLFAAVRPQRGSSFTEQAEDALQALDSAFARENARRSMVRQTVFLAEPGQIDTCRKIMRKFHGADLPVTCYVPQSPCDGALLSIEVHGFVSAGADVEIERAGEQLVVVRHDGITWAYCAAANLVTSAVDVYAGTALTLHQLEKSLQHRGLRFDQIVRTWLYLGGIVADDRQVQRYKELNRARSDFYKVISFLPDMLPEAHGPVYPASTGIGTEGRELVAGAIALTAEGHEVTAVPLENPRQTPAYDYARSYSPRSPRFSRGMALSFGSESMIIISGTASITNSESRHLGDVVRQTHEAFDNIEALIAEENLARHGLPGLGTTLDGLVRARVYLKRREDFPLVEWVCARRIGQVPTVYTVADVCRPELLVEIEATAFSRTGPGPEKSALHGPHFQSRAPRQSWPTVPAWRTLTPGT